MPAGPTTIAFRGLVSARWVLIGLVALGHAVLGGLESAGVDTAGLPTPQGLVGWLGLGVLLLSWVGFNGWARWRAGAIADRGIDAVGATLLADTAALTIVFALSGAASNPFTALYFVPITLATQVSPRWTWLVGIASAAAFGALFLVGVPEGHDMAMAGGEHAHHQHMGHAMPAAGGSFAGHLTGMWIAFAASGVLITVFVHRIAVQVERQRDELVRLRGEALEDRHLAALGTLAAGAAHELGTPLGTIALLGEGLEDMEGEEREEAVADLLAQVDRCKRIVQQMSSPELRADRLGGAVERWSLGRLAEHLQHESPEVRIELDERAAATTVGLPWTAVARVVRELVRNAETAARAAGEATPPVSVRLRLLEGAQPIEVRVEDRGAGMSDEQRRRAFEPFYTTAVEGEGSGLGLYLSRAQVRQLGGHLTLQAGPGGGTAAVLRLPLSWVRPGEERPS